MPARERRGTLGTLGTPCDSRTRAVPGWTLTIVSALLIVLATFAVTGLGSANPASPPRAGGPRGVRQCRLPWQYDAALGMPAWRVANGYRAPVCQRSPSFRGPFRGISGTQPRYVACLP